MCLARSTQTRWRRPTTLPPRSRTWVSSRRPRGSSARHSLEVRRRVLGAEHLDTLASANYFFGLLWAQGEVSEAARITCETLEVC